MVIYVLGICLSFLHAWIGLGLYAFVAATWFIPDKRFEERKITAEQK
jgi:protein-S-isoprenylcysteine O-methyltransferase Ste14